MWSAQSSCSPVQDNMVSADSVCSNVNFNRVLLSNAALNSEIQNEQTGFCQRRKVTSETSRAGRVTCCLWGFSQDNTYVVKCTGFTLVAQTASL